MNLKKLFRKPQKALFSRADFIASIPKDISILEIGPFYTPLCLGENVKYFDILDRDALIRRAVELELDFQEHNVPHIDYVSPVGDLLIVDEQFDAMFSSYVIEHQPDLIKHLQDASKLLSSEASII